METDFCKVLKNLKGVNLFPKTYFNLLDIMKREKLAPSFLTHKPISVIENRYRKKEEK